VIERFGDHKYALLSRGGRVLGIHRTRRDAQRQERAISISKARAAGYAIPPAATSSPRATRTKTKTTKKRRS
jgi:hypothetical protein